MRNHKSQITNLKSKCAFTLVEMLVVVAIVALLVALLLPAMKQARVQSRITVCSAHVRGLNMAVRTYGSDHRGWGPPHSYNAATTAIHPYPNMEVPNWYDGSWDSVSQTYHVIQVPPGGVYSGIRSYVQKWPSCADQPTKSFCAANQKILGLFDTDAQIGDAGYERWRNMVYQIKDPRRTILVAEGLYGALNGGGGVGAGPAGYDYGDIDPNAPFTISNLARALTTEGGTPRHDAQGLNWSFVDGHVAFYYHRIPTSDTDPSIAAQ